MRIVQKVDMEDGTLGFLLLDGSLHSKLSNEESIEKYREEIDYLIKNYRGKDCLGCKDYYESRMRIIKSQLRKILDQTGD